MYFRSVTSAYWSLESPATRLFTQEFTLANNQENIKASRSRAFVAGGMPSQRHNNSEIVCISWRQNEVDCTITDCKNGN